ncbi:X-Pro dipeptidyl-peptidase (S15 family) [Streptococcus constellatus]|uniref:X-Pro dipeptidyl-peptidase (S15 family) n=1 Tax=Streptococcus constellatus TaxID=76860 RepID=A0A564TYL6_STRCV|nr:alpha/beta hydrolase [Streptococcus constellatus]VUX02903.1 X-Pro dipeptidyl-peptidase (S15 family) [Streptococcus gordonii]VUX12348.1 X-Pro dipeptidyl-peptidase (S15 family) [Streptococcus constellatus]
MAESISFTNEWDKVFAKSDKVDHEKVTFTNHFGITLVADLYKPKGVSDKLPALAVAGPFGAVKEQSSGLYAQEMAKRGFLAIAFDPSYTGESGGFPRYMQSPDINTEDFQATVDFLISHSQVNADRIGIIGICGWGGYAINVAAIDPRIKVSIVSTMYDLSRVTSKGYFDENDSEEARYQTRLALANQRTLDAQNGDYQLAGGVVDPLPADAPDFVKDYYAYYKQPRGYHARSLNSNEGWAVQSHTSLANTRLLQYSDEIRSAVLVVHGDKAHSYYMGKDAFSRLTGANKKMITVAGANHTDLYDQVDVIPFDEIEKFIKENM